MPQTTATLERPEHVSEGTKYVPVKIRRHNVGMPLQVSDPWRRYTTAFEFRLEVVQLYEAKTNNNIMAI